MIRARGAAGGVVAARRKNCDTVFRPTRDSPEVQGHLPKKIERGRGFLFSSSLALLREKENDRQTDRPSWLAAAFDVLNY